MSKFEGGKKMIKRLSVMKVRWKLLTSKMIMWLAAEITLTCLGIDDLADYTEFLSEKYVIVHLS